MFHGPARQLLFSDLFRMPVDIFKKSHDENLPNSLSQSSISSPHVLLKDPTHAAKLLHIVCVSTEFSARSFPEVWLVYPYFIRICSAFSPTRWNIIKEISLHGPPTHVCLDAAAKCLWVGGPAGLTVISVRGASVTRREQTDAPILQVMPDEAGGRVFVLLEGGLLDVWSARAGRREAQHRLELSDIVAAVLLPQSKSGPLRLLVAGTRALAVFEESAHSLLRPVPGVRYATRTGERISAVEVTRPPHGAGRLVLLGLDSGRILALSADTLEHVSEVDAFPRAPPAGLASVSVVAPDESPPVRSPGEMSFFSPRCLLGAAAAGGAGGAHRISALRCCDAPNGTPFLWVLAEGSSEARGFLLPQRGAEFRALFRILAPGPVAAISPAGVADVFALVADARCGLSAWAPSPADSFAHILGAATPARLQPTSDDASQAPHPALLFAFCEAVTDALRGELSDESLGELFADVMSEATQAPPRRRGRAAAAQQERQIAQLRRLLSERGGARRTDAHATPALQDEKPLSSLADPGERPAPRRAAKQPTKKFVFTRLPPPKDASRLLTWHNGA
eukprot:gnl/Chilomastix_cuspidata/4871.p1 GENE.gnl/Chilomastix_cuspidata/4871~~gnl/Chilomastix_cuspidata/4871.p1  ORF type:complete len:566 (+),score=144.29 gnl/Chilomastix_cuspidata/4871:193-1890(+)